MSPVPFWMTERLTRFALYVLCYNVNIEKYACPRSQKAYFFFLYSEYVRKTALIFN